MKKILLATVAVALFAGMALAQVDQTGTTNIEVKVVGVFTMTLTPASGSTITYGDGVTTMVPGTSDNTKTVGILVKSNFKNNTWYLKVNQDQILTDAAIVETIPSANFTHTSTGGLGVHADAAATEFVTTTPTLFYTCDAAERKNIPTGTTITQQLQLLVPDTQAAGTYINTLTYTLTVTP
ncbi:hypothetical protein HY768_08695 [candidate division TA06 bacterium]|uniref:DUF4402 domain-containing protein n=1 Tax=candidate division TA06 bacterium TaxID=2250710 RepID=A0A933ML10_UNCT6|nr:hypothetical protein [candidate division TA06 bacterium]